MIYSCSLQRKLSITVTNGLGRPILPDSRHLNDPFGTSLRARSPLVIIGQACLYQSRTNRVDLPTNSIQFACEVEHEHVDCRFTRVIGLVVNVVIGRGFIGCFGETAHDARYKYDARWRILRFAQEWEEALSKTASSDDVGSECLGEEIPGRKTFLPIKQNTSVIDENIEISVLLIDMLDCFVDGVSRGEIKL